LRTTEQETRLILHEHDDDDDDDDDDDNDIALTRKTDVLHYTYKLWACFITRTATIKDLGVQIDSELYFPTHM
jgi:hypothetical protein